MIFKRHPTIFVHVLFAVHLFYSQAFCSHVQYFEDATNAKQESLLSAINYLHLAQGSENAALNQFYKESRQNLLELTKSFEYALHSLSTGHNGIDILDNMGIIGNTELLDFILKGGIEDTMELLKDRGGFSEKCANDTGHLIMSMVLGQGWALKFLDAAGKLGPGLSEKRVNFVGDYHLCRSLAAPSGNGSSGFKGSYCTLKVGVTVRGRFRKFSKLKQIPGLQLKLGACMPDSCNETELTGFVANVIDAVVDNSSRIHADPTEIHSDKRIPGFATRLSIVYIILIGLCMIVGTLYDVFFIQWPVWKAQWAEDNTVMANGGTGTSETGTTVDVVSIDDDDPLLGKEDKPRVPTGKLAHMILAYSVYTNGKKVLDTKHRADSISCVHGIRFISMLWVILGHVYYYGFPDTINAITEYGILFDQWQFRVVSNAFISVDTFFLLSGLLTAYVTIGHFKRTGRWIKWRFFYLHRYLRITPPYALVLTIIVGLQQYCGEGPLWPANGTPEIRACEQHWWANLLYINNIVYNSQNDMCLFHTWYLPNDMQFFIVSPIMLIALGFRKRVGVAVCCTVILVSALTTGILSLVNQWPATIFDLNSPGVATWFSDYYIAPWCRIGPFVIGILTGFYLAENPRRKISMSKTVAVVGWIVATITALAALYGIHGNAFATQLNTSIPASALYNALARDAWAISVAWVIVACVSGWGGFVNTFLSWSPFVFLGRLSFMAYLIHPALLLIFFNGQQTLFYLDTLTISMVFVGTVVATYAVSFVLMLAFESPMVGLERVFIPQKKD